MPERRPVLTVTVFREGDGKYALAVNRHGILGDELLAAAGALQGMIFQAVLGILGARPTPPPELVQN